jgi:phosphoglycerate dehydrogenase-like enzyme
LKVISNYAAGTDNIAVAACTARGIPVGNTPGALTDATADLTLALILTIIRQLPQAAESARQGDWKMWYAARWLGQSLKGAKLGVVGMGKIGSAVARRARSFGMDIIYSSRSSKEEIEQELGAVRMDTEELLAACDIVTLHAPLTPETRHLINERTLQLMKPTAVLINTARGAEVDTDALYQALRFGRIYAAGLDVTDPEPLPADHPLYTLPNCVILPHIGSATTTARKIMAEMACANLMAGLTGTDLPNCANPGYRRIS